MSNPLQSFAGDFDDRHPQQLSPGAAAAWQQNAWCVSAAAAAPGAVKIQLNYRQDHCHMYAAAAASTAAADSGKRGPAAEAAEGTNAEAWA